MTTDLPGDRGQSRPHPPADGTRAAATLLPAVPAPDVARDGSARRTALGVLMAGVDAVASPDGGVDLPAWVTAALADGLGAVCLFACNTPDVPRTRALTDALRAVRPRLLVAVDEEGGDVTRLQARGGSSLPGAAALGAADDPVLTRACAEALGRLVAMAGIDLDLAPVLDVASEPANPVIGVRAFGAAPEVVTRHGRAYVAGLAAAGVAACAKHFPGHGDTTVDSHVGLPRVAADQTTVRSRDVAPFAEVRTDAVMTAHLLVPALGEGPASLSRWATALARDTGHEGLVVTDALQMAGASAALGLGEACVQALEAGADLLCLDSPRQRDAAATLAEAVAAIEAALAAGRLDPGDLRQRAKRVAALARATHPPLDGLGAALAELDRLGLEAARRAVAATGDVAVAGPVVLVDLRVRADHAAGRTSPAYADAFAGHGTVVTGADLAAGTPLPPDATPVVLVRLPLADPDEGALLDQVLRARPDSVVVHTGVAAGAPAAQRLVVAHGNARPNAQVVADLVVGRRPADPLKGRTVTQSVAAESLTWSTEQRNPDSAAIDQLATIDLVDTIVRADAHVAAAVREQAPQIAAAAELVVAAIEAGGVVHYAGAGTSGRLGVLDAVELYPTYDAGPETVRAHLAGGMAAMLTAVEGAEDDDAAGAALVAGAGEHDVVVGLAASGRTPYVMGALAEARRRGLRTIVVSVNPAAPAAALADVAILPDTGPEVVTGSTRMKAGTAQKLVLNTLSTAVMVRLGRTYENLMIDMRVTNRKLAARAVRMLTQATGVDADLAQATLDAAGGRTRTALVALLAGVDVDRAAEALAANPPDSSRRSDPSGIRAAVAWLADRS